jgi:hypothetical protein
MPYLTAFVDYWKICNCLVGTRYSGFGTRGLDILRLKSSKLSIIAFRIPNSQSRLSNYENFIEYRARRR